MSKPLEGITVLDFTQFFAGPIATLMLGDMGAEIIKLENPPLGDATRYNLSIKNEKSSNFTTRNRGKKSVAMNLKDEKQKAIFFEMLKTADVVIENGKPGTLEKYGLTYEAMKAVNPAIVYTSVSGYGQTGPYRTHAAFDGAVQAEGGIISVTGEDENHGVRCGAAIADAAAGLVGCIGTLGALYDAKRTGQGRRVDIAMMDVMVTFMENLISAYCAEGRVAKPMGNRMYTASPFTDFLCGDGKINNVEDIVKHPQVAARNMLVDVIYKDGTTFKVPGAPIKMSDLEEPENYYCPTVGGDTFEVLSRYIDEDRIHEVYDDVLLKIAEETAKKYHP